MQKRWISHQRHDDIKFELQDLGARARIPSEVRDEPQIYPGRSADVEETEGMSTPTEECGDLLIMNIFKHPTDCIVDVRITNLDAPSFPRAREEEEIPPSLTGPTPSLISLSGFM